MKMMNRLMALVMALVMCCALAGAETVVTPEDVMASVNGTDITRAEFEVYLENVTSYYENAGYDVTDAQSVAVLKEIALLNLVQVTVMDQKIAEMNMSLTEEEKADATQAAREDWESIIDSGLSYYGATADTSDAQLAALLVQVLSELESMGYSEQSYIDEALQNALYVKLENEMVKDVTITDDEVIAFYGELVAADEAAYKDNAEAYEQMNQMNQMYLMYGYTEYYTDLYYKPEGYRSVTHILLSADETLQNTYNDLLALYEEQQSTLEEGGEVAEPVTAEAVEEARLAIIANVQPTIDEIHQKLADGAAFADLIPQYTQDPGMNNAAAIAEGYEVHMDSINWVTEFRDAAFTVDNIGDVTEPVVTSYGVHILQYVADVPGGPVELTSDLMETLRVTLLEPAQATRLNETMSQWIAESDVVYSDEAKAFMSVLEGAE